LAQAAALIDKGFFDLFLMLALVFLKSLNPALDDRGGLSVFSPSE
jgi:hypothetical protein